MELCLKCSLWGVVVGALLYLGIQSWMKQKSYVFNAEDLADITKQVLEENKSQDPDVIFAVVEERLRHRYKDHILSPSTMEWIFVNAGGWMGAMRVLHASTTEYVLFFGTAIDTSGHSGRYWANISDTIISGTFVQWQEGTTKAQTYGPGDTVLHDVGATAAIQWTAPFWAVEYGRGFIPSTLGFALADTVFSTQDFYIMYRTIRIYIIALIQEIFQGNL